MLGASRGACTLALAAESRCQLTVRVERGRHGVDVLHVAEVSSVSGQPSLQGQKRLGLLRVQKVQRD